MKPVRLGLAGFGRWGRVLMRNMVAHPSVVPAALASRRPEAAGEVPDGCRMVGHWRELLELDLDGLVVATPPAAHAEIGLAAIGRGLPLLLEKPLTLDAAEARALGDAARRADALVMVDHIHLFSPAWRRLRTILPGLGGVRRMDGLAGNRGPYRADTSVLWDWGPHDLSMMLDVTGALPDRIAAVRDERRAVDGGTGETVSLSLTFGMVAARATLSTLVDRTRRFSVECDGGTLVYDGVGPVPLALDGKPLDVPPGTPVETLLGDFAAAVAQGRRDHSGLALGVRVVEVLEVCQGQLP